MEQSDAEWLTALYDRAAQRDGYESHKAMMESMEEAVAKKKKGDEAELRAIGDRSLS